MRRVIIGTFLVCLSSACASDLVVFDSKGAAAKGVPVGTAVLVKVTTTTSYTVDPRNTEHGAYCVDDTAESYKVLPLGDLYFVSFKAAELGKSEFSVDFNDSGLLKSVKLNSDPRAAENIEAASKLISSVAEVAKPLGLGVAMIPDPTAQQKKNQYCIKKSETTRIERAKLP